MSTLVRRRLLSATCILGCFVAWELLCRMFHVSGIVLPRPTEVLITLWTRFPAIWPHALQTLYATLVGFGFGIVIYFTAEQEPALWAAMLLFVAATAAAVLARQRRFGFALALLIAAERGVIDANVGPLWRLGLKSLGSRHSGPPRGAPAP